MDYIDLDDAQVVALLLGGSICISEKVEPPLPSDSSVLCGNWADGKYTWADGNSSGAISCSYVAGNVSIVREAWAPVPGIWGACWYRAGVPHVKGGKPSGWFGFPYLLDRAVSPAQFFDEWMPRESMPEWASRAHAKCVDVRFRCADSDEWWIEYIFKYTEV